MKKAVVGLFRADVVCKNNGKIAFEEVSFHEANFEVAFDGFTDYVREKVREKLLPYYDEIEWSIWQHHPSRDADRSGFVRRATYELRKQDQ